MGAFESVRGAACLCGVVLIRGSAGFGGLVCCAKPAVAAISAAKAGATRFTVHLLVSVQEDLTPLLRPKLSETADI